MAGNERRNWTIRKATVSDVQTLLPLLRQLYEEVNHDIPSDTVETVAPALIADDARFVALLAHGANAQEAVGLLTASESTAIYAGGRFASIQELFVEPSARSLGVGRALLAELRQIAGERNWCRLEVTAPLGEDPDSRTLGFYRSNGFEPSGPRLKLNLP